MTPGHRRPPSPLGSGRGRLPVDDRRAGRRSSAVRRPTTLPRSCRGRDRRHGRRPDPARPRGDRASSWRPAAADPFIGGVVGWVDLTDRGVGDTHRRAARRARRRRLVGIRHQVHDEPDPAGSCAADVRRGPGGGRGGRPRLRPAGPRRASCRPRWIVAAGDGGASFRDRPRRQAADPRRRDRAVGGAFAPFGELPQRLVQALRARHRGRPEDLDGRRTWRRSWISRSRRSARRACCSARTGRCACSPPRYRGRVAAAARDLTAGLRAPSERPRSSAGPRERLRPTGSPARRARAAIGSDSSAAEPLQVGDEGRHSLGRGPHLEQRDACRARALRPAGGSGP